MGKTNNQRIQEAKKELFNIEERIQKVEQQISESKTFLDEISQHREHTGKKSAETEDIHNIAISTSKEIKKIKEDIEKLKEELHQKLNATEVKKEEIDKFFIKTFGEKDEQGNYSGGLKERLVQKEEKINKLLIEQENQYKTLFNKIESLLPAATSTGLATAYSNQKNSYKKPVIIWTLAFIFSLTGLCATGLLSFEGFKFSFEILDLEKLVTRSPIFLPLIWLATFSSKQYRQNKRLEQEYVYKEILTRTYQGYKKEFESQDQITGKETLSKLNEVLITAISKNPSEIMDDGRSEDTPSIWKRLFGSLNKQ